MSDLCSSNCGCERDNNYDNRSGCGMNNSCLWIILLLIFCGGNTWGLGRNGDCGCDSCMWIILLLIFCGGNTFGGCGCGCNNY